MARVSVQISAEVDAPVSMRCQVLQNDVRVWLVRSDDPSPEVLSGQTSAICSDSMACGACQSVPDRWQPGERNYPRIVDRDKATALGPAHHQLPDSGPSGLMSSKKKNPDQTAWVASGTHLVGRDHNGHSKCPRTGLLAGELLGGERKGKASGGFFALRGYLVCRLSLEITPVRLWQQGFAWHLPARLAIKSYGKFHAEFRLYRQRLSEVANGRSATSCVISSFALTKAVEVLAEIFHGMKSTRRYRVCQPLGNLPKSNPMRISTYGRT